MKDDQPHPRDSFRDRAMRCASLARMNLGIEHALINWDGLLAEAEEEHNRSQCAAHEINWEAMVKKYSRKD